MKFRLADARDDARLRALVSAEPMPGWVRLKFTREPSFFDGVSPEGHTNQVMAVLDGDDVVGMGCRSIRTVFIDGKPREFGYLSSLRSKPRVRGGALLGRGYRFLRELHRDGKVPGYLTTIVEQNRDAMDLLTSGRADLPVYLPWGRCFSYAIPLQRRLPHGARRASDGVRVRSGSDVGAEALMAFVASEGARRQFFPVFRPEALGRPPFRGVALDDFRVALRGDRIVGLAAVWDQRRFRQTVVAGYAPLLRALRPLLNAHRRIAGHPTLPAPGGALNMASLAFTCVGDHEPGVFAAILLAVGAERAASDLHFLCLALHADDPLNAALKQVRHFRFDSRLYVVCWDDTREQCNAIRKDMVPHVEVSML